MIHLTPPHTDTAQVLLCREYSIDQRSVSWHPEHLISAAVILSEGSRIINNISNMIPRILRTVELGSVLERTARTSGSDWDRMVWVWCCSSAWKTEKKDLLLLKDGHICFMNSLVHWGLIKRFWLLFPIRAAISPKLYPSAEERAFKHHSRFFWSRAVCASSGVTHADSRCLGRLLVSNVGRF